MNRIRSAMSHEKPASCSRCLWKKRGALRVQRCVLYAVLSHALMYLCSCSSGPKPQIDEEGGVQVKTSLSVGVRQTDAVVFYMRATRQLLNTYTTFRAQIVGSTTDTTAIEKGSVETDSSLVWTMSTSDTIDAHRHSLTWWETDRATKTASNYILQFQLFGQTNFGWKHIGSYGQRLPNSNDYVLTQITVP